MAISPTPEQLQALTFWERLNFRVTHTLNSTPPVRRLLTLIGTVYGKTWVRLTTSKTVTDHGFELFEKLDPERGVLLVANHRSFFDQFAITGRLYEKYGAHHNIYFPIRANFFYDSPLSLLVNIPAALGVMYPPIIRDKKRRQWNRYATDLMVDLLKDPRNMIGFHPEGTRNKGTDPYSLLPPKPGCGELIYRSRPNVVPVFLQGFPKTPLKLLRENLFFSKTSKPLVHMVMGEPLDFTEEFSLEEGRRTYLLISQKVMDRVAELAKQERVIRGSHHS